MDKKRKYIDKDTPLHARVIKVPQLWAWGRVGQPVTLVVNPCRRILGSAAPASKVI